MSEVSNTLSELLGIEDEIETLLILGRNKSGTSFSRYVNVDQVWGTFILEYAKASILKKSLSEIDGV